MGNDNSHSANAPGETLAHLARRKSPQQSRSKALFETILDAAARVLVERSADFNTNLVADTAGVSVGSLYQYFPNKDALLAALIERQAARERQFIGDAMRLLQPTNIRGALEAVLDATFAFRRQNLELQQSLLAMLDRIPQYPALRDEAAETMLAFGQMLTPLVPPANRPQLQNALFVVCNAVFSLTHRGIVQRPNELSDEELRREIVELVVPYLESKVAVKDVT